MKLCLIVDDSSVIRKVAKALLNSIGYEVIEAETGKESLGKYYDQEIRTREARVRTLLSEFETSLAGRIGLQVDVIDWTDGPEPRHGTISIEEADRWLASPAAHPLGSLWRARPASSPRPRIASMRQATTVITKAVTE